MSLNFSLSLGSFANLNPWRKNVQVLVTDDSYIPSLGIVRSLGSKGIDVSVLAESSLATLASRSRYCSGRYVVPSPSEGFYFTSLMDVLGRVHFDLIIPVGYASTSALAQRKAEVNSLSRLEVADYQKIQAAADKCYVHELATRVGVPAPKTVCPTSFDDAVRLSADLQYPVVMKAPCEVSNSPVHYARTRFELLEFFRTLWSRKNGGSGKLPLVQEFIPGYGCGFFALYQNGVCKRTFMHRRVRETPPSGGVSCCAESFYDPKLQEYGTRLLDRLEWHGVAMVEFRYDLRDNDYKLMEINPKFWGSLDLALAAGVDFPYYLCQMAQGETLKHSEEYDRNVRFHWPLLEMKHLWKRPASIGAVLADSLNPQVKSNLRLFDLKPNVLEPFSRVRAQVRRTLAAKRRRYKVSRNFETHVSRNGREPNRLEAVEGRPNAFNIHGR